jgi:ribonucleoside-diphosphate reductase alpha chain
MSKMRVLKRDGSTDTVRLDKISLRIKKQTYGLNTDYVDYNAVAIKVVNGLYDGVTTDELDNLASETAASMATIHPDYSILAARIAITAMYKNIDKQFTSVASKLYNYIEPKTGEQAGMISDGTYSVIEKYGDKLDKMIVHDRDFNFDYFGYKTLEKSYLLKIDGKIAETPQHLYMRVAVGIWGDNIEKVESTYNMLSTGVMTHATPTLFNAGTKRPQLSSCFLLDIDDDSIQGIYKTLSDCAAISQSAGGIGLNIHKIRSKGSYIKGTNGTSNGIIPMLKVFNETARYVDQGGGKRKGSIAVYLEPWHADIYDFLDLRKNHGKEELRARDLFLALWISDIFMERVKTNGDWTLFSPNEVPGLIDAYDDGENKAFSDLYQKYESEGKGKTIKARELWARVLESQIETGTPYMLYKDPANAKSNQKNLGTIKSSNLCTEILEYTDKDETAVCNLASIALPKMVNIPEGKVRSQNKGLRTFDFDMLYDVAYKTTVNLNQVIDINYYPTPETKRSNFRHRPIGIGIQGLADVFAMMGYPFDSEMASKLNKDIFETIYFAAVTASKDRAKDEGHYETFKGSPLSEGKFQYELWGFTDSDMSGKWDWNSLRDEVVKHGVRNSLLMAPMPTASTAQILGNNECFEPFTANIYKRNTLSGEYVMVNKHLIQDLVSLGLWSDKVRLQMFAGNGSVQHIDEIPQEVKDRYKTVWEISQKKLIDMAADRGAFIDQSQSMNLFMEDVNAAKLTAAHFHAWEKGLKTGMYYLRTRPKAEALKGLGIDMSTIEETPKEVVVSQIETPKMTQPTPMTDEQLLNDMVCSLDNPDDCEACGS